MRGVLSPGETRLAPTEAARRPVACCFERPEQLQSRSVNKKMSKANTKEQEPKEQKSMAREILEMVFYLVIALVAGALIFAFVSTGRGRDTIHKFKRTFQEMGGGLFGGKKKE